MGKKRFGTGTAVPDSGAVYSARKSVEGEAAEPTCSKCGLRRPALPDDVREWRCRKCGSVHENNHADVAWGDEQKEAVFRLLNIKSLKPE
jgi:hypothetical protein